jgi:cytochrome b6-f complex iron-sulfur subunit
MKRREFLRQTGAAAVACGLLPACGEDASCSTSLISVEPDGTLLKLPLSELDATGGSVWVDASAAGNSFELVVARLESGDLVALSRKCTHQNCDVCFEDGPQEFYCPCHGSRFSSTGSVKKGPAGRPLKEYPVIIDGDSVVVDVA